MERAAGRTTGDLDDRIKVSVADFAVAAGKTITTSGLGSCLGVALYEEGAGVGGLLHPMLPAAGDGGGGAAERFVDSGIELVLETMVGRGADRTNVVAKVTGGATIVDFATGDGRSIGDRNVEAARRVCETEGIDLVDEETGGDCGRTMRFDTTTGRVVVERTDGVETVL